VAFAEGGDTDDLAEGVGGLHADSEFTGQRIEDGARHVVRIAGTGVHDDISEGADGFDDAFGALLKFLADVNCGVISGCAGFVGTFPEGGGIAVEQDYETIVAQKAAGRGIHQGGTAGGDDAPIALGEGGGGGVFEVAEAGFAFAAHDVAAGEFLPRVGGVQCGHVIVSFKERHTEQGSEAGTSAGFTGAFWTCEDDFHQGSMCDQDERLAWVRAALMKPRKSGWGLVGWD